MKDTIASISTTMGVGAISIVRASGLEAIDIVSNFFVGKDLKKVDSHTINHGFIVWENKKIDEVLVSVMKAPKTFTTEDVVEINCHGGVATTKKILEILLLSGCRLAEPGEFTKRAFINGRIDLVEAEATADIIAAQTDQARSISMKQLDGSSSRMIRDLRNDLLGLIANIEVNIDYPEYEDIEVVTNKKIKEAVVSIREKLSSIIKESERSLIYSSGIKTAIIGRPNVGKSSILNRLLDENKAIVTEVAGTTRDIVEGKINIDGIVLNLIDTAGIRKTDDVVEKIGVEKTLEVSEKADLIIFVLNNNESLSKEDMEIMEIIKEKTVITVINKCDLPRKIEISKIGTDNIVEIDTIDSLKIIKLKDKINEILDLNAISQNDNAILGNTRQISLAKSSLKILEDIETALENEEYVDMIEIDIKRIWEELGKILGESYEDELLDQLFSQFCLGK